MQQGQLSPARSPPPAPRRPSIGTYNITGKGSILISSIQPVCVLPGGVASLTVTVTYDPRTAQPDSTWHLTAITNQGAVIGRSHGPLSSLTDGTIRYVFTATAYSIASTTRQAQRSKGAVVMHVHAERTLKPGKSGTGTTQVHRTVCLPKPACVLAT